VLAIVARRNDMLDRMEATGQNDLRAVVKAFVHPVAQQLCEPDGGKEVIRINAQLIVPHTLAVQEQAAMPLRAPDTDRLARVLHTPGTDRLARVLRNAVAAYALPEPIVQQRLMLAAMLLFHGLADHSRMLEAAKQSAVAIDTELFVNDLEDSIVALLSAPLSESTAARLAELTA
jgi:hypothetical protein